MNFKKLSKVALHDHLDGGVRPETLIELAQECVVQLPSYDALKLRSIIAQGADRGSLESYLEMFGWTVPVMQTSSSLTRIACEAVQDLAADGVVLAEIRFAPLLHTKNGLSAQDVIEAVSEGLKMAWEITGVPSGLILCGIRSNDELHEISQLFHDNRNQEVGGVIGIDLAGPEAGYPVANHPSIKELSRAVAEAPITIHAGEADGISSIWQAVEAGARRIGHGTRLIDDINADRTLLRRIVDQNILLEVCVSSNVQTGSVERVETHPLRRFIDEGVRVNIDVDNRLMSDTCYSAEYAKLASVFKLSERELLNIGIDAVDASFLSENIKLGVRKLLA